MQKMPIDETARRERRGRARKTGARVHRVQGKAGRGGFVDPVQYVDWLSWSVPVARGRVEEG